MMSDSLVEIEKNDLTILKELYTPNGIKSYIAYTTIDNYIHLFEQDPNIKHVKFFCLNGDFSDGTFVVTDRCSAFADTNNNDHDRLFKLCTLLDYSKGYSFLSIRVGIQSVIEKAIKHAGVELIMNITTLLYFCPKESALLFDVILPNDIELRGLTEMSHLEKVHSVWPHRNVIQNPFAFLHQMAKYNVNVGAFKSDGSLVAWLLRLPTGLLGALQTDADHFGHGYGTLVTKYVSKKIAEMGHDIYAGILEENHPSRRLFEKLGFKSIGQVHWITTAINGTPDDE